MNPPEPLCIGENNLSHAWSCALLHIIDHPGTEVTPLLVSVSGFDGDQTPENTAIRAALDSALRSVGEQEVRSVANTLFPTRLWKRSGGDRHELYRTYLSLLPRLVAMCRSKNGRGLYFARLIAYDKDPVTGSSLPHLPEDAVPCGGNQLEYVITQYRSRPGVRRSMFQASVFDPARDHLGSAQLGFPCMQHLSFVPHADGTLAVNAFYATQQVFQKAYGNYLGICRIGHFMAGEMGLRLGRMNCYTGVSKLEGVGKTAPALERLVEVLRAETPLPAVRCGGQGMGR